MKIQAESQNIGAFPKSRRIPKIEALSQNFLKSPRLMKITALIKNLSAQVMRPSES
jgi:hypothetical protein